MAFELDCPVCASAVSADIENVGRTVACPHCSAHFMIPAPGSPPRVLGRSDVLEAGEPVRFTFSCQRCDSILEGNSHLGGQLGRCPTCAAVFHVPHVDPETGLPTGPAEVADDGQLPTPVHAYAAAGDKAPQIRRLPDGESVVVCPRCSSQMPVDANICSACGIPFTIEGASEISGSASNANSLASASLIVGVVSLPLFMIGVVPGPIAILLGVAGLRRAKRSGMKDRGRNLAIAGILCGAASVAGFFGRHLLP